MLDDIEQMIKQQLLEDLISHMADKGGDSLKPDGMAVQVAAPDKAALADGLDKAKDALPSVPEPGSEGTEGDDDDERRLLQLLGDDDEDEDERR